MTVREQGSWFKSAPAARAEPCDYRARARGSRLVAPIVRVVLNRGDGACTASSNAHRAMPPAASLSLDGHARCVHDSPAFQRPSQVRDSRLAFRIEHVEGHDLVQRACDRRDWRPGRTK